MPTVYLLYAYCIPTVCLLYTYCKPTAYLLYSYWITTVCLLHTYCIYTAYLLHTYCIPTVCHLHVNRAKPAYTDIQSDIAGCLISKLHPDMPKIDSGLFLYSKQNQSISQIQHDRDKIAFFGMLPFLSVCLTSLNKMYLLLFLTSVIVVYKPECFYLVHVINCVAF